MKTEERKSSEQEKNEAAVKLLSKLRKKLYSDSISTARMAAFRLSWMQEDGLDILKDALFGNFPRTAKKAAAYGLRSMNGRMRKMASEVLKEGLKHHDRITREACEKSLLLMEGKTHEKVRSQKKPTSGRFRIRDIPKRSGKKTRSRGIRRTSGTL
ncbi:MAG: hypothetical protein ACYSTF_01065 [Planctomycetota bacterium]|jgi:hypothetical protein